MDFYAQQNMMRKQSNLERSILLESYSEVRLTLYQLSLSQNRHAASEMTPNLNLLNVHCPILTNPCCRTAQLNWFQGDQSSAALETHFTKRVSAFL